ncbi:efflux RND transporter periplasmic adaptor subunit [Aestuariivita sp.]|jgi:multidrug efflux system membrane fusion protein|uniref:efflux RND transporter periplasmic adaptor subunit n=1 Tax=Aestuariivita sp. TaxID=1872407 RepID=UPI00216BA51E|nr:efflux RND transporter periplasmic adaptor subunit [Aestuariivita sp.]MCE8009593.1 efflux RND transporter periplasmic adaptor subunit [Aestuariivita sp.]
MRVIPVLIAILVTAALYIAVFQREALVAFALGDAAAQQPQTEEDAGGDIAENAQAIAPSISVVALRSQAQEVDSAVILRGQTEAHRQVDVRAETSATVISEPLRKGHFVEAGELLCHLDPGTREASLSEARAQLEEARARLPEAEAGTSEANARLQEALARLDEAEINDNAASRLSEGGFASDTRVATTRAGVRAAEAGVEAARAGLESARTAIQSAKSGVQSAEAAVATAETEIDRLEITAPFAGLLESDTAELGSLMQPGGLCATVIQLDPIKLVGFVPETEVDRVEVGALAGARLVSGREVQGRVTFLSRSADPTTRTFRTEIQVANPDFSIRDGQTAEILIAADGLMAHKVPQSALTLNSEGKLGLRTVSGDDLVEFVPITLLRDTIDGVWVTGLPDQADVIVVGQDFVTAGVRVKASFGEVTP